MRTYIGLLTVLVTFLLTSCEQLPGVVNEAKREVRKNLIDPNSAIFDAVTENQNSGAVCGFVNGKNKLGAYVGANPFIYEKNVGVTLIKEPPQERDFEQYFENLQYRDSSEYIEFEDRCKGVYLWQKKCGTSIMRSPNKYCEAIDKGRSIMEVYQFAEQFIHHY